MGYKESDMTEATAHTHITLNELCMPGGSDCKESGAMQETQICSLDREDPLQMEMATHFLPGEFHGEKGLMGYSPWDRRVGHK